MLASERFLKSLEKKGAQEGRQEGRQAIILNIYIETGWPAKKIPEITKFSEEYIQGIIERFKNRKEL